MKSLLFGLCVFSLTNIVLVHGSFGGSELAKTHPDHPGKCWSEENQMSYSPGDSFIVAGACREITCFEYENKVLIFVYRSCPIHRRQTDLVCKYVTKNPDQEFPACCPDLVC